MNVVSTVFDFIMFKLFEYVRYSCNSKCKVLLVFLFNRKIDCGVIISYSHILRLSFSNARALRTGRISPRSCYDSESNVRWHFQRFIIALPTHVIILLSWFHNIKENAQYKIISLASTCVSNYSNVFNSFTNPGSKSSKNKITRNHWRRNISPFFL